MKQVHHRGKERAARTAHVRPKPPSQQLCGNCGRVLKDLHALQVHQRHCTAQGSRVEHDLVGLVRAMRDAFETERREMLRFLMERDAQVMRMVSQGTKDVVPEKAAPHPGIEVGTIPPPQAAPAVMPEERPSLSEDDVRRVVREEIAALPSIPEDVRGALERLDRTAQRTDLELSGLSKTLDEMVEMRRFAALVKAHEKLDARLDAVMHEVGFGESMDVAKIPPNILDIVYQATLRDLVHEIGKIKGTQEVPRIVDGTLEDVRMNTSGSELFTFDGRRIVTRGLVESIEQGLISARQVQTTYNEILSALVVHVPGYKPKSFRAMIKIKSQEYAVDMVTRLHEHVNRLDKTLDNVMNMVAAFSAQMSARFAQLEEMAMQKAEVQALEEIRAALTQLREGQAELTQEVQRLTARMEMTLALQPAPPAEEEGVGHPLEEREKLVLSAIGEGAGAGMLMKRIGKMLSPEEVNGALDALVAKGMIEVQRFGKGRRYRVVESQKVEVEEPQEPEETTLTSAEEAVLGVLGEDVTLAQMRRRLSRAGMRYTEVLRTLRILIDKGRVAVETRGHSTIYRRIAEERKEEEVNQNA
ncbi:MAG: hypothetical protein AB1665_07435 [Candidatus Thermoplasmatota archaeon]